MSKRLTIALVQIPVERDIAANRARILRWIAKGRAAGATLSGLKKNRFNH